MAAGRTALKERAHQATTHLNAHYTVHTHTFLKVHHVAQYIVTDGFQAVLMGNYFYCDQLDIANSLSFLKMCLNVLYYGYLCHKKLYVGTGHLPKRLKCTQNTCCFIITLLPAEILDNAVFQSRYFEADSLKSNLETQVLHGFILLWELHNFKLNEPKTILTDGLKSITQKMLSRQMQYS